MGLLGLRKFIDACGCTRPLPVCDDDGDAALSHPSPGDAPADGDGRPSVMRRHGACDAIDAAALSHPTTTAHVDGHMACTSSGCAGAVTVAVAHVLVDMNCIVHSCFGHADGCQRSTPELIHAILARVRHLLTAVVMPYKSLTFCFDGPAPVAKLQTQRLRRRRVGLLDAAGQGQLSALAITAGSLFMVELENALAAQLKLNHGRGFLRRRCPVFLHGSTVPGEGEAKIARALAFLSSVPPAGEHNRVTDTTNGRDDSRSSSSSSSSTAAASRFASSRADESSFRRERRSSSYSTRDGSRRTRCTGAYTNLYTAPYNPHDSICVVGNDIDLVLTCLGATMYHNITLLAPSSQQITVVAELLHHWLRTHLANDVAPLRQLPAVRLDFIFLFLLNGGDHYTGAGEVAGAMWRRYHSLRSASLRQCSTDGDGNQSHRIPTSSNHHAYQDGKKKSNSDDKSHGKNNYSGTTTNNTDTTSYALRTTGHYHQTKVDRSFGEPGGSTHSTVSLLREDLRGVNMTVLYDLLDAEQYSGHAEAEVGVQLLRAALWSLVMVVTGVCLNYQYDPQQCLTAAARCGQSSSSSFSAAAADAGVSPHVNHLRAAARAYRGRFVELESSHAMLPMMGTMPCAGRPARVDGSTRRRRRRMHGGDDGCGARVTKPTGGSVPSHAAGSTYDARFAYCHNHSRNWNKNTNTTTTNTNNTNNPTTSITGGDASRRDCGADTTRVDVCPAGAEAGVLANPRTAPLSPLETFVALMPHEAVLPAAVAAVLRTDAHRPLAATLLGGGHSDIARIAAAARRAVSLAADGLTRSECHLRHCTTAVQLNVLPPPSPLSMSPPRRGRGGRYEQHRRQYRNRHDHHHHQQPQQPLRRRDGRVAHAGNESQASYVPPPAVCPTPTVATVMAVVWPLMMPARVPRYARCSYPPDTNFIDFTTPFHAAQCAGGEAGGQNGRLEGGGMSRKAAAAAAKTAAERRRVYVEATKTNNNNHHRHHHHHHHHTIQDKNKYKTIHGCACRNENGDRCQCIVSNTTQSGFGKTTQSTNGAVCTLRLVRATGTKRVLSGEERVTHEPTRKRRCMEMTKSAKTAAAEENGVAAHRLCRAERSAFAQELRAFLGEDDEEAAAVARALVTREGRDVEALMTKRATINTSSMTTPTRAKTRQCEQNEKKKKKKKKN